MSVRKNSNLDPALSAGRQKQVCASLLCCLQGQRLELAAEAQRILAR